MQRGGLRTGRGPQLLGQFPAQLLEALQRVALPPGAVEGAHVGHAQPLAQRVPCHQRPQFRRQRGVLAQRQPDLGVVLDDGQAQLLQPGDLTAGEEGLGHVRVGGAAPEGERVGEQVRLHRRLPVGAGPDGELLEPHGVDHVVREQQPVAGGLPDHLFPAQHPAQLGDLGLQGVGGPARRAARPQVLDQAVGRHRPATVDEQVRQKGAHLRFGDPDGLPLGVPDGQRAEHPVTHARSLSPNDPQETVRGGRHSDGRMPTIREKGRECHEHNDRRQGGSPGVGRAGRPLVAHRAVGPRRHRAVPDPPLTGRGPAPVRYPGTVDHGRLRLPDRRVPAHHGDAG